MNRIVDSLLGEIKDELSLADSENKRIERYVKRAYIIIKNYLKNEELTLEEVQEKYPEAILLIVEKMYSIKEVGNIQQKTVGEKSITYNVNQNNNYLTDDVMALLPVSVPKVRSFY